MASSPWSFLSPDKKLLDAGVLSGGKGLSAYGRKDKVTFYSDSDDVLHSHEIFDLSKNSQHVREVHLQNKGNNLVVLGEDDKSVLFRTDVEKGVTIGQYSLLAGDKDAINCLTLTPSKKFDLHDDRNSTVLSYYSVGGAGTPGGSSSSVKYNDTLMKVLIDTRCDATHSLADDNSRTYKGARFTCIASSRTGHIAAGSDDGTVRLYDDVGAKANAIRAIDNYAKLGFPVLGIDLASRGDWLVWTYKEFLIAAQLGPEHWKRGKQAPLDLIKLKLDPAVAEKHGLVIKEGSFLPAKFDVGPSLDPDNETLKENYIISYFGPLRCSWNLRRVQTVLKNIAEARVENKQVPIELYATQCQNTGYKDLVNYVPESGRDNTDVVALAEGLHHIKM